MDNDDYPVLHIISYGHKRGPLVPPPDLLFDMRRLPNPPKHVRSKQTGVFKPLRDWLFADASVQARFAEVSNLIQDRVSEADSKGERVLRVGVCCQLGHHRSVAVVEELGQRRFNEWETVIHHRDLHLKRSHDKRVRSGREAHDVEEEVEDG